MSPVKFGDTVNYTEFGKSYRALVVKLRILDHHLGENDEPLLTLIVVKPVTSDACANCGNRRAAHGKPAPAAQRICGSFVDPEPIEPANALEFVHVIGDVPHDSHEFEPAQLEALAKQGITVSQAYPGNVIPGGRWSEIDSRPAPKKLKATASDEGDKVQ